MFVIPKDAAVSQWKEIPSLSGFHVRMIDTALKAAEKQMKNRSSAAKKTVNASSATKETESKRDLSQKVGTLLNQTNLYKPNQQAGAQAILEEESALDKYKRLHKSSITEIMQKKAPVRRRPTLISNKPKANPPKTNPPKPPEPDNYQSIPTLHQKMALKQTLPTSIMKSHRVGTEEHKKRMEAVKKIVAAKAPNKQRSIEKLAKGEIPFKVFPTAEKAIAHVPILKHFHSLSDEEELILDASLSFVESFRVNVFKREGPLNASEKKALRDWLYFVSIALPQEWGKGINLIL